MAKNNIKSHGNSKTIKGPYPQEGRAFKKCTLLSTLLQIPYK